MPYRSTDIGGEIVLAGVNIAKAQSAGTINGTGVDCKQNPAPYDSCIAFGKLGSATGSPTAESLVLKVQDSADNSTWADYKPDGTNVAASVAGIASAAPGTNDGAITQLNVNLKNARRYVRVVATLGFTAGTSPTNDVVTGLVFGGGQSVPTSPPNP